MNEPGVMFLAGEVSGDARCAELVSALKLFCKERGLPQPHCFGAGGSKMAEAGVELVVDMTRHAVIGHVDAIRGCFRFKRLFDQLLNLACERKPAVIVLVDFSGFNLRFARAIRRRSRHGWTPRIIYFISPQLWASRPGRAKQMERDVDLLISIIPFEMKWYAEHAPRLKVEFVGHPLVDECRHATTPPPAEENHPTVVLLPGSRRKEITAHLPVMWSALQSIRSQRPVAARLHLPDNGCVELAGTLLPADHGMEIRTGSLHESLASATLAITKSGTVSLECALMRVPSIVLYITSPLLFYIGRRVVNVPFLAMPNLLAGKAVYPELIQDAASPGAISGIALDLLNHPGKRAAMRTELDHLVSTLGTPGASRRAAILLQNEIAAAAAHSR